jgi:mannonate dehydratase
MEQTWRRFGLSDPITVANIRQAGPTGIVTALHDVPTGQMWTVQAIADRKKLIGAAGLTWSVVDSAPGHQDIKDDGPLRDQWIGAHQRSLRDLAGYGLDVHVPERQEIVVKELFEVCETRSRL